MTPEEQGQTPDKTVEKTQHKDQVVVPLHAEEVSVAKRRVVTGQVKVGTVTRQSEQLVEELLEHEHVQIERTPIGKQVDKAPPCARREIL